MIIGRDMITDINKLKEAYDKRKKKGEDLGIDDLRIFEDTAYVMARHANPDMEEKTADEWLDSFNMFSIYEILPEILNLWAINTRTTSTSKGPARKSAEKPSYRNKSRYNILPLILMYSGSTSKPNPKENNKQNTNNKTKKGTKQ